MENQLSTKIHHYLRGCLDSVLIQTQKDLKENKSKSEKDKKTTGKMSNALFYKLIIIATDYFDREVESKTKIEVERQVDTFRSTDGLVLFKKENYTEHDIQTIKMMTSALRKYINNDWLIKKAVRLTNKNIMINKEKLDGNIKVIEEMVKKYEDNLGGINMVEDISLEKIGIFPRDYIVEILSEEVRQYEIECCFDAYYFYNNLPELCIIKGRPYVLALQYEIDEDVVDMLISIIKQPNNNGFDQYCVFVTELDPSTDVYYTTCNKIPVQSLSFYIQEILNNYTIAYIHPESCILLERILNSDNNE